MSLAIELATNRPHIAVGGDFGVKYYTPGTGKWNGLTLSSHQAVVVAIHMNQGNNVLFVAYARLTEVGGPNLYYLTKP